MTNQTQSSKSKIYDLEERTAKLGEEMTVFCRELSENSINKPLINQLVRSATSVGANYMEADAAGSKQDFRHKVLLCKKEAKETLHWLRMISKANPNKIDTCRILWKEAHELVLIFSSILNAKKLN